MKEILKTHVNIHTINYVSTLSVHVHNRILEFSVEQNNLKHFIRFLDILKKSFNVCYKCSLLNGCTTATYMQTIYVHEQLSTQPRVQRASNSRL